MCFNCGNTIEEGNIICEKCGKIVAEADEFSQQPARNSITHNRQSSDTNATSGYMPAMASQRRMLLILLLDASAHAAPYFNQLLIDLSHFIIDANSDDITQNALDFAVISFSDNFSILEGLPDENDAELSRSLACGKSCYSNPVREALQMAEVYNRNHAQAYKPWVILIASGEPSDDIASVAVEVQNMQSDDKLRFMALGILNYDSAALKKLTDVVFRQKGTDFTSFFEWVRKSIGVIVRTIPGEKPLLPALEGNVYRDR